MRSIRADGGEKDGVKLDSKPLPGVGDSALPLVSPVATPQCVRKPY